MQCTFSNLCLLAIPLTLSCLVAGEPKNEPPAPPPPVAPVPPAAKVEAPIEPWKAELLKKLEQKVTLDFQDIALNESLAYIQKVAGVDIILDPRVVAAGPPNISLKISEMSLSNALNWICKLAGVQYELRNQVIFISKEAQGEPAPEAKRDDEAWKAEATKKLERKVSFEFVDTPLTDAVKFIQHILAINMIVDPAVQAGAPAISLKVSDMQVSNALSWVCKLSGMKYELRDQSIFISKDQITEEPKKEEPTPQPHPMTGKLSVKLGNNRELEVDASILNAHPEKVDELFGKFFEDTRRNIVAVPIPHEFKQIEFLVALLKENAADQVTVAYSEDLGLLTINGANGKLVSELEAVVHAALDAFKNRPIEKKEEPKPKPVEPKF